MDKTDLIDELEEALNIFLDELYNSIKKRVDIQKTFPNEINFNLNNSFNFATPIRKDQKHQIPKNIFFIDFSSYKNLILKIEEGANFTYKTRGKRNTIVVLKLHPDLPNFISKISENHTKHAIYDSTFNIDISKVDMTNLIPIIFVFDKSTKTGELELLGLHYVELQKCKIIDDKVFIYNEEWIDIYTKETRNYNGSLKITMFLTNLKDSLIIDQYTNEKINKKRERVGYNSFKENIINNGKIDKEVQTDEYHEEIIPENFEGKSGEINFGLIHDKVSKFKFIDDMEIINDDFVYKSNYPNLDTEKILFQDETDDKLHDLLEPLVKYECINDLKKRIYNPEEYNNDLFLFNSNQNNDDIENEILVKKMIYNSEKYSLYSDFKWNYGYNDV